MFVSDYMKKLILFLFLLPTFSYAENKSCWAYLREGNLHQQDKKIEQECKSGYILDFRVYKTPRYPDQQSLDKMIITQTRVCDYKKSITITSNADFYGFTCVYD